MRLSQFIRDGIDIYDYIKVPIFAYTGDTTIDGLLRNKMFLRAEVLVTECTYLNDVTETIANRHGHIHVNELRRIQDKISGTLVLCHFSPRYDIEYIKSAINGMNWTNTTSPLLFI